MVEKRLEFRMDRNVGGDRIYTIHNKDNQYLGNIRKHRVGRFLHWCFFPAQIDDKEEMWFSNGCLKEISEYITELYRGDRNVGK